MQPCNAWNIPQALHLVKAFSSPKRKKFVVDSRIERWQTYCLEVEARVKEDDMPKRTDLRLDTSATPFRVRSVPESPRRKGHAI